MVDITEVALLAASFFFVALSVGLLVKYRQVSERVNVSTDLGRDLWSSLEQRLKKQDERILDMMGRVEVIQSRVMTASAALAAANAHPPPMVMPQPSQPEAEPALSHTQSQPMQQLESQESQESQPPQPPRPIPAPLAASELDETQVAALRILGGAPKNTRQLTDALGKSREHTARVMKELFELGLVQRNASSKPFVYQLTDEGKKRLPPSPT
ncbi:MAG: MarR family transcriptional regulator [Nitrososphaerota archaeon]|nr:MarR family transcriptional regulator [Nitrososphaerota archaeon]